MASRIRHKNETRAYFTMNRVLPLLKSRLLQKVTEGLPKKKSPQCMRTEGDNDVRSRQQIALSIPLLGMAQDSKT